MKFVFEDRILFTIMPEVSPALTIVITFSLVKTSSELVLFWAEAVGTSIRTAIVVRRAIFASVFISNFAPWNFLNEQDGRAAVAAEQLVLNSYGTYVAGLAVGFYL